MTTLFDVLVDIARELDQTREGVATGGSATTLVDSLCMEPDDFWNNGTVFLLSGGRANSSVMPTDWVYSTHTLTIPTGTAIASGVRYVAVHRKWPRAQLVSMANVALSNCLIEYIDETITVDGSEYDLPAGVARVYQVFIGSASDGWKPHYQWQIRDGKLLFYANTPADGDGSIRMIYRGAPASVALDTDTIDAQIDRRYVVLMALAMLHQWRAQTTKEQEPGERKLADQYMSLALQRKAQHAAQVTPPHFSKY